MADRLRKGKTEDDKDAATDTGPATDQPSAAAAVKEGDRHFPMETRTLNLILVLLVLGSGCICFSQDTPTTSPTVVTYLTTTTAPKPTTSTLDYQRLYQDLLKNLSTTTTDKPTTTTSSTTTTSTSTTTTSTTLKARRLLSNVMPSRLNISVNWKSCTKDRDCMIVPDCCGWDYGFKYAINEWSATDFERYRSSFCDQKAHRSGCGWNTPDTTQTRCQQGVCVLSYGGFVPDDLQDENFTYTYDWMRKLDDTNYTII